MELLPFDTFSGAMHSDTLPLPPLEFAFRAAESPETDVKKFQKIAEIFSCIGSLIRYRLGQSSPPRVGQGPVQSLGFTWMD